MEVLAEPIAEPQQIAADSAQGEPQRPRKARFGNPFNAQNAREMALRSHAKRRQREEELRKAAEAKAQDPANYVQQRLMRTREQLRQLDKELEDASDPKAIKAICDSIKALSEVERILAGRPLPGSHRPSKASTARPQSVEPSE